MAKPPSLYPRLVDLPNLLADRLLALECQRLFEPEGPLPSAGIIHRRIGALSAALLAEVAPSTVVIPLFAGEQDAVSMIERLEELGFAGRILVIAPALPRPHLVERELRAAGPGDRLMLVTP